MNDNYYFAFFFLTKYIYIMKKIFLTTLFVTVLTISVFSQSRKTSTAEVSRIDGVPVFFFCYPTQEYEEIKKVNAGWSALSESLDGQKVNMKKQVREMISHAKRKERKGKIEHFDAIIIDAEDFSGIVIKFID